jgi:hypothetical protein
MPGGFFSLRGGKGWRQVCRTPDRRVLRGRARGMMMVVWEGELRKIVEGSSFFVGKTTIIE